MKRLLIPFILAAIALLVVACNLPGAETAFPTPNATMTEIFTTRTETKEIILQTPTPAPPTNTPEPTFTFTPTNTNTPEPPTATPTPDMRAGTTVKADYLYIAPTIDGVWDEWKTDAYPMKKVVYGANNWTDAKDLEGSYRVGWDFKYLYIAVKVYDDKFVNNKEKKELFKGDSIEILLDADLKGDFDSTTLNGDDYQLGISVGKGTVGVNMTAYLWYPTSKEGVKTDDIKMAAVVLGNNEGYRLEARIPWSIFGISADKDLKFGFAISVSDNDSTTEDVQQTMISNIKPRVLTDPTTWGNLILIKK